MSGKRTKALRREFRRIHGRAPETTAVRTRGIFAKVWRLFTTRQKDGSKTQKRKPVEIMATMIADSHSEFRRFKRARRAA